MKEVTLKNGSTEVDVLVVATTLSLQSLMEDNPIAFYELVMLCRDRTHQLFGSVGGVLRDRNLIEQNGQPHGSIRNIVLSAVEGDMLDMCLVNPLAQ